MSARIRSAEVVDDNGENGVADGGPGKTYQIIFIDILKTISKKMSNYLFFHQDWSTCHLWSWRIFWTS